MDHPRLPTHSRRRAAQAAWAAPAVLATAAAPAASASIPSPAQRYVLVPTGTESQGTLVLGRLSNHYSPTTSSTYTNHSVNAVYLNKLSESYTTSKFTDADWAVERREAFWEGLVPGRLYTFTMRARSAPYYRCPTGTAGKAVLVSSSPDGSTWRQQAHLRSHRKAPRPMGATAPETVFSPSLPDDICEKSDTLSWSEWKQISFTETAGAKGRVHFRYDAWMPPRVWDNEVLTASPEDPDETATEFPTGNASFQWGRPMIVG